METVKTHYFCEDRTITRENIQYIPIANSQGIPTSLGAWEWGTVLIDATVAAQVTTLTLTLQISHDGVTWFPVWIHNLGAAANKWILAANVAFAANANGALIGISIPAPYIRLGAISAAGGDTTLTAIFVAIT